MRREVRIGDIGVRSLDRNAHLATLVDVLHHVVRRTGHRCQQRRHELHGIVRFEISRVIGQQRISRGVRFIETISRELRHQVENLFDLLRRILALRGALHEAFALLRHLLGFFLAHGAAQQIGFTQRVSCQSVRDLHHLFLIHNYAQRFLKNFLQFRKFVFDLLAAVLAVDEVIDHAALDWTGPVEGVQSREIFDGTGLIFAQHVAHAIRFKLEHAGG